MKKNLIVFIFMFLISVGIACDNFARDITEKEKRLLVSIDVLEQFGISMPNREKCESYTAKKNLDGSQELEYEYDSEKDPTSADSLFFKSEAEINPSVESARKSFPLQVVAYRAGARLVKGRELDEAPHLLTLGNQSYSAYMKQNGKIIGNVIVIQQGKIVHSFIIIGLYFDNEEDLGAVLNPVLRESRKFE